MDETSESGETKVEGGLHLLRGGRTSKDAVEVLRAFDPLIL